MKFHITQTSWHAHGDQLLSVRQRVFVEEQGVPAGLEHDAEDASAVHLLVFNPVGDAVGTARMLRDGHIGRMAVLAAWRGQGIGGQLLQHLVRLAEKNKLPQPFLHAQCGATGFYERFGFVAEGPVFLDAGIEHRLMTLTDRGTTN